MCDSVEVRWIVLTLAGFMTAGVLAGAPASADPAPPMPCDEPGCTPGIAGNVTLGAPCSQTTYFAFGTTSWGRLVFCGSPRRYEPRWFRSPPMIGVKLEGASCINFDNAVAQAPDGLFLICQSSAWTRADT